MWPERSGRIGPRPRARAPAAVAPAWSAAPTGRSEERQPARRTPPSGRHRGNRCAQSEDQPSGRDRVVHSSVALAVRQGVSVPICRSPFPAQAFRPAPSFDEGDRVIWDRLHDESFQLPPDKPLMLAAYAVGTRESWAWCTEPSIVSTPFLRSPAPSAARMVGTAAGLTRPCVP